jgi:hypothetical protein
MQKKYVNLLLPALMLVAILALASCANSVADKNRE